VNGEGEVRSKKVFDTADTAWADNGWKADLETPVGGVWGRWSLSGMQTSHSGSAIFDTEQRVLYGVGDTWL